MSLRTRKIAALLASASLLGAAGVSAQAATQSDSGSSASSTTRKAGKPRGAMSTAHAAAIAKKLGVSTAELKAAMDAARPAKPADGERPGRGDRGAGMAADLASALGVDAAAVKEILDANRPAKQGGKRSARGERPSKPDHTKLIAALAEGLDLETAKVEAAFEKLESTRKAGHEARRAAMYAAIADALDKTQSEVRAAFESVRPAKSAR